MVIDCPKCNGQKTYYYSTAEGMQDADCDDCDEHGKIVVNPLLEEYADCLHFILRIGLELNTDMGYMVNLKYPGFQSKDVTKQFNMLFSEVSVLQFDHNRLMHYDIVLDRFFGLGGMLGFTWEQIETAYFAKSAVNHQRQETSY